MRENNISQASRVVYGEVSGKKEITTDFFFHSVSNPVEDVEC